MFTRGRIYPRLGRYPLQALHPEGVRLASKEFFPCSAQGKLQAVYDLGVRPHHVDRLSWVG